MNKFLALSPFVVHGPLILIIACCLLATSLRAATAPEIENKISDLLGRMTIEEKLGQMSQTGFPRPLTDKVKQELRAGRWGSFYNGGTVEEKNQVQQIAVHESRLGIPLIYGQDAIHGYLTTFPIPLGQSTSWNPELIQQAAHVVAQEAASAGVHWTFAPMMDICRDARWGRIAETLGEDPYLSGVLASAMVKGFQGDSLSAADSIAACGKHYVGYGAAEAGRDYNTTWIPENLLRDVYLIPFQRANEAGVASYMSAFNNINGIPASGNIHTLRTILRDEWKFDGVVVSDYDSISEMIPHGYAADEKDAALKSIRAGVDMEMVSHDYITYGKQLVEAGDLDIKLIDESVRNILRLKCRLGLFDQKSSTPREQEITKPSARALEIARNLAAQSLVLLKNKNNILPLDKSKLKIAVIGPLAASPVDQEGSWAGPSVRSAIQTPYDVFHNMLGDALLWAPGLKSSIDTHHDGFAAARAAAGKADVVLLFLGEGADLSGEARSRAFLTLPGAQEELVAEVAKAGKPMIAIILAGRPLTFHNIAEKMDAVLYAWHPGTMGGPAIADAILGNVIPSGRLTTTFPRTVGQLPLYYNHMNTGRPPTQISRGEDRSYTSRYLDVSFTPEYPFGYGLSYTRFEYSDLKLSAPQLPLGGKLVVSTKIKNAGSYQAYETPQLYIRDLAASLTQPVRELKAFRRILLKPGETQTVEFTLSTTDLAFHNEQGQLATEPGKFYVWISPDSASGQKAEFTVIPR